jgi:stage II sporulation protein M
LNYLPRGIISFFKQNITCYIILLIVFISGVILGSISVNMMSDTQLQDLSDFINGFFANAKNISVDPPTIFYSSLSNNLKTLFTLFICGLVIIGLPLIFILIFFRGFIMGFTVGFFISEMGIRGIVFSLLSVLPQNIIIVPSIISVGVAGIGFSSNMLKNRRIIQSESYIQILASYFLFNFVFSILLVVAALIEGYISPVFIKLLTPYM